ncbi:MAG: hypothetical protein ACJA2F_001592, partial [Nitriliruptoraceae bacterium]
TARLDGRAQVRINPLRAPPGPRALRGWCVAVMPASSSTNRPIPRHDPAGLFRIPDRKL